MADEAAGFLPPPEDPSVDGCLPVVGEGAVDLPVQDAIAAEDEPARVAE